MTITEEELEAWADLYQRKEYAHELRLCRLIAEVRRQRKFRGELVRAKAKIEEQAKEIAKLEGETTFGHGRAVAGLERFR